MKILKSDRGLEYVVTSVEIVPGLSGVEVHNLRIGGHVCVAPGVIEETGVFFYLPGGIEAVQLVDCRGSVEGNWKLHEVDPPHRTWMNNLQLPLRQRNEKMALLSPAIVNFSASNGCWVKVQDMLDILFSQPRQPKSILDVIQECIDIDGTLQAIDEEGGRVEMRSLSNVPCNIGEMYIPVRMVIRVFQHHGAIVWWDEKWW